MRSRYRIWDGSEMHNPPHSFALVHGTDSVCKVAHQGDDTISLVEGWHHHDVTDEVKVLFYTGLDDAEGTPIYEGDIIEFEVLSHLAHYEVAWYDKYGAWYCKAEDGDWMSRLSVQLDKDECTVIGNCYESPELLEVSA